MHTRRNFIKISSLGIGATALLGGSIQWSRSASSKNITVGSKSLMVGMKIPTYCEVCFWKCAGWTYVTPNNEIQKITENEDDTQ